MWSIAEARDRLNEGDEINEELQRNLAGQVFVLPIFSADADIELRNRTNYGELLTDVYATPLLPDIKVDYDIFAYSIVEVEFQENNGIKYKIERALNKTDPQGTIFLTGRLVHNQGRFEWGELSKYFEAAEMESFDRISPLWGKPERFFEIYHEYKGNNDLIDSIVSFNMGLSDVLSTPNTIQGIIEEGAKYEAHNAMKERWR